MTSGPRNVGVVGGLGGPAAVSIRCERLFKGFQANGRATLEVLRDINLTVEPGQFVALLGPSGCGKSTLLNIFAGITEQSAGELRIEAETKTENEDIRRGYVFQGNSVLPWRTVLENVELGSKASGQSKADRRLEARRWIERVGLSGFEDAYPSRLSGGMRKRVSLATVFSHQPALLFMDEPFAAVDAQTRAQLQMMLLTLWQENGCTVVFVTHDIAEAILLADRVVVMSRRPGMIHADHTVYLKRPRKLEEVRFEPAFRDLYQLVWAELDLSTDTVT
jgi:NitT/TauT family transport system ATP-binding protein